MENPFKEVKEQDVFQWIWNNKKVQMISMVLVGLAIIIGAIVCIEEWWGRFFILFGSLWMIGAGVLHPALAYSDMVANYDAFENSVNKKALIIPTRKDYKRIILAGAAGSGKDYLKDKFEEKKFPVDTSVTTRPMRDGEVQSKTYHYIGVDHFKHLENKGKLYESVNFNGAYYGTLLQNWENSLIFIMTPSGIQHITEEDRENCIIVYLNIEEDIRRKRMKKRSDNGFDEVERRITADNKDFEKFLSEADIIITDPLFNCDLVMKDILNQALIDKS